MPRSKGRKSKEGWPIQHTAQSSHSSQSETGAPKLCYVLLKILRKTLAKILGCLWANKSNCLIWASVAMTLAAGAFFFLPRVAIESSGPYDPSHPSPITFTISNINIVPLRDVQPFVGLCFINVGGAPGQRQSCDSDNLARLVFQKWFVKWLDVDEKYQIALEDAINVGTPKKLNPPILLLALYTLPGGCLGFGETQNSFASSLSPAVTVKSIGSLRLLFVARRRPVGIDPQGYRPTSQVRDNRLPSTDTLG